MDIKDRVISWLLSGDTGSSSEAICAHMTGKGTYYGHSYPSDPSDLGRCLRLLELVPEWKPRIAEMAKYSPGWAGLVAEWDKLTNLMTNEVGIHWEKGESAPATYKAMKLAQANGYRNDASYECSFNKDGYLSSAFKKRAAS